MQNKISLHFYLQEISKGQTAEDGEDNDENSGRESFSSPILP